MNRSAFICAVTALVLANSPVFGDPLAIVGAVKGKVEITTRSRESRRAVFGLRLERGDKVVAGRGATATLLFSDGNVLEIGSGSSVTIGGRVEKPNAPGVPGDVFAQVSRFVTGGSRETGLVALSSMRGERDEVLLSPRKTTVMEAQPSFAWRALRGATRYIVTVSTPDSALWTRETPDTTLAYPADVAPLPQGVDLVWEVEIRSDASRLHGESSFFQVMPTEAAGVVRQHVGRIEQSVGADTPACHFLTGSYLSGAGLHQEAIRRFEALRALEPESPGAREALARAYAAVGLVDLAAREYEAALSLSRSP